MSRTYVEVVILLLLDAALGIWRWSRRDRPAAVRQRSAGRRLWRPRTPRDCGVCQAQAQATPPPGPARPAVRPWSAVKSPRGAPKRIPTQGHACPNPQCAYHGLTDARVHALVGDGHHGSTDRIQDYLCQACGTKVSSRRDTALYRLKTPSARIGEVLSALAEGLDVRAAVRVFGHGEATITRWLTRAGQQAERLHQRLLRHLHLPHVQIDELRTRLHARGQGLWLWLALDPLTKIVPVLHLGPRTQQSAHAVVHALREVLAPGCIPTVTPDGLRLYYYALTAHFGQWVRRGRRHEWQVAPRLLYGQVQNCYRQRRLVRVRYRVLCGTRRRLRQALQTLGLSGRLTTAFVERVNLTVRQGVAALTRRTWATAQTVPGLLSQITWWRGYYHFVRPHHSLRVALARPRDRGGGRQPQRYRARTPAMAAGVTTQRWTVVDLLSQPYLDTT